MRQEETTSCLLDAEGDAESQTEADLRAAHGGGTLHAMLCSILLALDDTPGAIAARDLAFALARRTGAAVTALIVLDRPHTTGLA